MALFDVFSTVFTGWPEELAIACAEEIREATEAMLWDDIFLEVISRSTNSTKNVKTRFEFVEKHITTLLV